VTVKEYLRAMADGHAQHDWAEGRRWSCICFACKQAREEQYEPQGNNFILGDDNGQRG
jgi:hypothetical protein